MCGRLGGIGGVRQRRAALQADRRRAGRDRTRHLAGRGRGRRAALAAERADSPAADLDSCRRSADRTHAGRFRSGGVTTALVVGGGPNGLAAAVALASEGVEVTVLEAAERIGGGTRSGEAIVPGLLHDHCSAIHPMAVGSPFLTSLGLDRYGLTWRLA